MSDKVICSIKSYYAATAYPFLSNRSGIVQVIIKKFGVFLWPTV